MLCDCDVMMMACFGFVVFVVLLLNLFVCALKLIRCMFRAIHSNTQYHTIYNVLTWSLSGVGDGVWCGLKDGNPQIWILWENIIAQTTYKNYHLHQTLTSNQQTKATIDFLELTIQTNKNKYNPLNSPKLHFF